MGDFSCWPRDFSKDISAKNVVTRKSKTTEKIQKAFVENTNKGVIQPIQIWLHTSGQ